MVVPVYKTDLTTLSQAEEVDGGDVWDESTDGGWDELSLAQAVWADTDNFIQNTAAHSSPAKTGVGSLFYDSGVGGVTIPTDGAFLIWVYWAAPKCLDTEANGGIRLMCGSGLGDFYGWKLLGSDSYAYGGWANLATNPEVSPDYTVGTPDGTDRYFGWAANALTVPSKGNPFVVDAVRYGRCEAIMSAGDANDPATFDGFALSNDNVANRWGLIQAVDGGYQWKGRMGLGISGAVYFEDSNTQILIANTKKVTPKFNLISMANSGSYIDWSAISFLALGASSRGCLEVIDPECDVNIDSCSFTDMSAFGFGLSSTVTDTTFRRCGLVTQNSASFDGCLFDGTIDIEKALMADNLDNISDCSFIAPPNSGHAIRIDTTGTYSFNGNTFTGFGSAASLSSDLYNNSGGLVTINLGGGGDVPTVRNGAGATTDIVSPVVLTLTNLPNGTEATIAQTSDRTELYNEENITDGNAVFNYAASAIGLSVDIMLLNKDYDPHIGSIYDYILPGTDTTIPIGMVSDSFYLSGSV